MRQGVPQTQVWGGHKMHCHSNLFHALLHSKLSKAKWRRGSPVKQIIMAPNHLRGIVWKHLGTLPQMEKLSVNFNKFIRLGGFRPTHAVWVGTSLYTVRLNGMRWFNEEEVEQINGNPYLTVICLLVLVLSYLLYHFAAAMRQESQQGSLNLFLNLVILFWYVKQTSSRPQPVMKHTIINLPSSHLETFTTFPLSNFTFFTMYHSFSAHSSFYHLFQFISAPSLMMCERTALCCSMTLYNISITNLNLLRIINQHKWDQLEIWQIWCLRWW